MDSSTALRPSRTTPSTGIFSPGRTRKRSPTARVERELPLRRRLRRCGAPFLAQGQAARGCAPQVCSRALSSSTWPEQHQHGDHRGGFEIDGDRAVHGHAIAAGKSCRRRCRRRAVKPGDTDAHGDQREHVQIARLRAKASRARRRAIRPKARPAWRAAAAPIRALLTDKWWRSESGRPFRGQRPAKSGQAPIQNRRVMSTSSGFGPLSLGRDLRLECHAADRTRARSELTDLRDASGRCRSCLPESTPGWPRCFATQILAGIGSELGVAALRAEKVGRAVMLGGELSGRRGDIPAADRIRRGFSYRAW